MTPDEMRRLHPGWFAATDYGWLRYHRVPKVDRSGWNRWDDENRRNVANWSDNDFTREQ